MLKEIKLVINNKVVINILVIFVIYIYRNINYVPIKWYFNNYNLVCIPYNKYLVIITYYLFNLPLQNILIYLPM